MNLLISCELSNDPLVVASPPILPDLPDDLIEGCALIPITGEVISDLIAHRQSYAACRSLQSATSAFYIDLKQSIEG